MEDKGLTSKQKGLIGISLIIGGLLLLVMSIKTSK